MADHSIIHGRPQHYSQSDHSTIQSNHSTIHNGPQHHGLITALRMAKPLHYSWLTTIHGPTIALAAADQALFMA